MKKLVLALCGFILLISSKNLNAQGFPWLTDVEGGNGTTFSAPRIEGNAIDNQGNIYITGSFESTLSIGTNVIFSNSTSADGFVAKLDSTGSLIWIQEFGGSSYDEGWDIAVDNLGGVYVCGSFQGTATFDTITATATNSSSSPENFLIKYDTAGNALWIKHGTRAPFSSVFVDGYGKLDYRNGAVVYSTCYEWNTFSGTNADRIFDGATLPTPGTSSDLGFICSYQTDGTQNWIETFQPQTSNFFFSPEEVRIDASGNIYALYLSFSPVVFDSTTLGTTGYFNTVVKMDSQGQHLANYSIDNLGTVSFSGQNGNSFDLDAAGNLYVSGRTRNTSSTISIAGVTIPSTGTFIYKLDNSLNPLDAKVVSQNNLTTYATEISEVVIDGSGDLFFGGRLNGFINFNSAVLNGGGDLFFIKVDTALNNNIYAIQTTDQSGIITFSNTGMLGGAFLGVNDEIHLVGNVSAASTNFGTQTTSTNFFNSGYVTKIVDCSPLSATITPSNPVICGSSASVTLNATVNPNYNYQWLATNTEIPGATSTSYAATNPGTYSVQLDSLGCLDTSNTVTVTQEVPPTVTVPTTTLNVCNIAAPFTLQGGQPAGGVWSGTGVVNDTTFDPSLVGNGPVLLTYTYSTPSGCSNSAVRIANVVSPASLTVSSNIPDFCEGDQAFSLATLVSPAGGTYSGTGVNNNLFYPDSAGVGTHTVTYSYAVIAGCTSTTTFNIVVHAAPTINFPAFAPVCNSTFSFPLNSATPSGGTYSGNFTISNTFYPFLSGAGNFPVIYTVTQNGCTSSDTQSVQVDAPVTPTLSAIGPFCEGDAAVSLSQGTPIGGVYLVNGIVSTTFNPAALGVGSHTVQYAFSNACGDDTATQQVTVNPIPVVTLAPFGPYCENDGIVSLNQGLPAGGTYSGSGIVGNSFDPSSAQIGSNQIIYTYVGAGGCSASDTTNVTVFAKPMITMNLIDTLCIDQGLYSLIAAPIGGAFSGTGVSGTDFDPQVAGVGSHVVTYTYTNANNCSDTLTDTIEVITPVVVTLAPLSDVCEGDAPVTLTGGTPVGGTYSGAGVVGNQFNPTIAGAGTFDIVYSVTTTCGTRSDTQQITVNPAPIVTLPSLTNVCIDAGVVNLPQGNPAGGTYSGTGVAGNQFDPSVAGVGVFDIVYSFTSVNGCIGSDTQQIEVTPLPNVMLAAQGNVCIDAGLVTLSGGSPIGGTYSGTGVAAGQFDPQIAGVGAHTIVYSYTDVNGCSDTAQSTITVNDLPVVTWQPLVTVCANNAPITLSGGAPAGGVYSGPGVTAGMFNPSSVGAGTYTLTYVYTDVNGCADSAQESIIVDPLPAVSLNPFTDLCIDAGLVTLSGGSPVGGTYSGAGVTGGVFDPQVAGVGTHDIVYTVSGASCNASDTQQITVNPLPVVTLSAFADACIDAGLVALAGGSPVGGTYSGNGVSGNVFDPQIAGLGSTLITYAYTDTNGCVNSDTASIQVTSGPTVSLAALSDVCESDAPFMLSGGSPAGGTYSGSGVSSGMFDPSSAGSGVHLIKYVYQAPSGCKDSATTSITVSPLPVVTLSPLADICVDAGLLTLSGGSPAGGTYAGVGALAGQFDPTVAGVGTHQIIYSYTTNPLGCTASDTQTITVNDLPSLSFTIQNQICIDGGLVSLTSGTPIGGTYSGTGVSGSQFDPSIAGVGQHIITYTFTDTNACTNSITDTILVDSLPVVSLASQTPVCENQAVFSLTGGIPAGGTYSGVGVSGGQFNPATAGVGSHLITYTYSDANGCSSSDTASIVVNSAPVVAFTGLGSVCLDAGLINLTGGSPIGGTYAGTGVSGSQFDPLVAGVGQHIISYAFTSTFGCADTAFDTITVSVPPTVSLAPFTPYCINGLPDTLSNGSPAGGTYSGTGVVNGVFNPTTAGVGTHQVVYTYVNAQGCSAADTQQVTVSPEPNVVYNFSDILCDYASAISLPEGIPAGGSLSGVGVSGNQFDPTVVGAGSYNVIYSVTDVNGCVGSDTGNVIVVPRPMVNAGVDQNLCVGQEAVLSATGASTYVWSTTETTQSIVVNPLNDSSYSVIGTDTNGCEGFDTVLIQVNPIPVVALPSIDTVCADSSFVLDAGNGFTQYRWNTGSLNQTINVGPFNPGTTQTYWVLVEDNLRCTGVDTLSFYVEDCDAVSDGIEIASNTSLQVYPNPNQGVFTIQANAWSGNAFIQVVSITGALVYQFELEQAYTDWSKTIDLSTFENGVYTILVSNNEKVYRKQFLINR